MLMRTWLRALHMIGSGATTSDCWGGEGRRRFLTGYLPVLGKPLIRPLLGVGGTGYSVPVEAQEPKK